jgi:hypothetical protein
MLFNSYCIFHVLHPVVLAVHIRDSNSIFASVESSEDNMFCSKLLCGIFFEC